MDNDWHFQMCVRKLQEGGDEVSCALGAVDVDRLIGDGGAFITGTGDHTEQTG